MSTNSDKVKRLTTPQRQVLKGFLLNKAMTSLASASHANLPGKKLGGTHSSLVRIGFIEPIGRNSDRTLNFKLSDEIGEEKDKLLKIIDDIDRYAITQK